MRVRNVVVTAVIVAGTIAGCLAVWPLAPKVGRKNAAAAPPVARPATAPAPAPTKPAPGLTYMDVVRRANPLVATTQPLTVPVELEYAAHLVFHDPVYLDPLGNLWVTRPDAPPTAEVLRTVLDSTEYVVRDRPVFVHWFVTPAGLTQAGMVVAAAGGGYDWVTLGRTHHLAGDRPYRWAAAYSLANRIVVPTDVGVAVFDVAPAVVEHDHPLPGCEPGKTSPPLTLPDTRGVLAWSPWERGKPGSRGVSRFVDGGWVDLPPAAWPGRPIQLVMLLDGSVFCVAAPDPAAKPKEPDAITDDDAPAATAVPPPLDAVSLSIVPLEPPQFDAAHVDDLIGRLNDLDGDRRQAAYDELARYGPSIAPLLEKAADAITPAARARVHELLRNKLTPALGGMEPVDGRLAVAYRQADGTVLFFARAGVTIPTEREDHAQTVVPAWVVAHADGRVDRPLPPNQVKDQTPDDCRLRTAGDEWIELTEAGPQRFLGNSFDPLLPPAERHFDTWLGMAARRRWVFRDTRTGDTLVLDPTVADPAPRLPVWTMSAKAPEAVGGQPAGPDGTAGWDARDDPVLRHGENGRAFALGADGWTALKKDDVVTTTWTPPPTATRPTTAEADPPLLVTADGTRYYDGKAAVVVQAPAGRRTSWPLPPDATGTVARPLLARTPDGLLFLYNTPGRLLRLKPAADGFEVEATFTADVPNADQPTRLWVDPNGRLDMVVDPTTLCVMFPSGHVPRSIAEMMPVASPLR